jgi:hypothetical protein
MRGADAPIGCLWALSGPASGRRVYRRAGSAPEPPPPGSARRLRGRSFMLSLQLVGRCLELSNPPLCLLQFGLEPSDLCSHHDGLRQLLGDRRGFVIRHLGWRRLEELDGFVSLLELRLKETHLPRQLSKLVLLVANQSNKLHCRRTFIIWQLVRRQSRCHPGRVCHPGCHRGCHSR